MANLFDSLQDNAFDAAANTMGYPATWQPTAGGAAKTATVLYNDNTEKYQLSNMDFKPERWSMQYRYPLLQGLKESTDENTDETVTIALPAGNVQFLVRRVETEFDGKTFIAYLQKI